MKANHPTAYFDANTWIGGWPFSLRREETAQLLKRRLRAAGVSTALVSPLGAVLAPDPMPANQALLEATRHDSALLPVPIINPRLRIWREHLEVCCAEAGVKAIRIVPAWHGFQLRAAAVAELVVELVQRRIALVVTARLEDERQQHHALSIRGLSPGSIDRFLAKVAPTKVLYTGLYRTEIMQLAAHQNLLAEISMAEWDQTIKGLLVHLSTGQLCFGSLAPFLSVPANVAKVHDADIAHRTKRQIAGKNLQDFIRP